MEPARAALRREPDHGLRDGPRLTNLIFAYVHSPTRDGALTGGAFVPNGAWSPAFNGQYLYNDVLDGDISASRARATTASAPSSRAASALVRATRV